MGNIVVGIIFFIGGATGKLALMGTNSPGALMVVGVCLAAYGGFSMMRGRG